MLEYCPHAILDAPHVLGRFDAALRHLPPPPARACRSSAGRPSPARGKRTCPASSISRNVVFTSSGRAAIALALRDLGIRPGDRVLVPTYHCPTMIAPVAAAGATPLFFPLDEKGTPRIAELAKWDLSRVRAMIAAHYFGLPQPMARIRQFCDDRGIALIEDCAHAMFGEADGKPIGAHGHYAIASLTKFLPTVDGGCLVYGRSPARAADARLAKRRRPAPDHRQHGGDGRAAQPPARHQSGDHGRIRRGGCVARAAASRHGRQWRTSRHAHHAQHGRSSRRTRSSGAALRSGRGGSPGRLVAGGSSPAGAGTIAISRRSSPTCRAPG